MNKLMLVLLCAVCTTSFGAKNGYLQLNSDDSIDLIISSVDAMETGKTVY